MQNINTQNSPALNSVSPIQTSAPTARVSQAAPSISVPSPVAQQTSSSTSLAQHATPLNDRLLEELDELLKLSENDLKLAFQTMNENVELVDSITAANLIALTYPKIPIRVVDNTISLFNSVLPSNLSHFTDIQSVVSLTQEITYMGSTLLTSINNGTNFLEVVCKHNILKRSRVLLEKLHTDFEKKLATHHANPAANLLTNDEIKENQLFFKSWEKNLVKQEGILQEQKVMLTLSITSRAALTGLHYTKTFTDSLTIAHSASVGTHLIGVILYAVQLRRDFKNDKVLKNWQAAYQQWQAKTTDVVNKHDSAQTPNSGLSNQEKTDQKLLRSIKTKFFEGDSIIADEKVLKKSLEDLDKIIHSSKNLLHKRQAIFTKKCLAVEIEFEKHEPKIKERNQAVFDTLTTTETFNEWYNNQPQATLIENYVNHQNVLDQLVKLTLKNVVESKCKLEKGFLKLNLFSSGTFTSISLISLGISVALLVLGILTIPTGVGVLLLISSFGPAALTLGIMFLRLAYELYKKPHTTIKFTYPPRLAFNRLNKNFHAYRSRNKQKKLMETAKVLHTMHLLGKRTSNIRYKKALINYEKAKVDFKHKQSKLDKWTNKLINMERKFAKKGWKDFIRQTSLVQNKNRQAFDSLRALDTALKECDFSLLSEETKQLLSKHLGLDLQQLQDATAKDPLAISSAIKQYTAMTDQNFVGFLRNQLAP